MHDMTKRAHSLCIKQQEMMNAEKILISKGGYHHFKLNTKSTQILRTIEKNSVKRHNESGDIVEKSIDRFNSINGNKPRCGR